MNSVAQPLYLGLDIGGTEVLAAAADGTGTILDSLREATLSDLESGLALLHRMISHLSCRTRSVSPE
jgi:predicted NBD/HSP70 family sugar kinase